MERLLKWKLDQAVRENTIALVHMDRGLDQEIEKVCDERNHEVESLQIRIDDLKAEQERIKLIRDRRVAELRDSKRIAPQTIMAQEKAMAVEYAQAMKKNGKTASEVRQALDRVGNWFHLYNTTVAEVVNEVMDEAGVAE